MINKKQAHIVIDARLYGPKHTGIGRYTKNLLQHLIKEKNFSKFNYTLIIYEDLETEVKRDLKNNFNYVTTTIKHYSLSEQLLLPFLIRKLKPDLVHFTHFNKPIFYFGKSVVTIHDLIKHFFKGRRNTTKNALLYWVKHFFYLITTRVAINTSQIIVPSNFWKDFLIKSFKTDPKKITTTHEAVDPNFLAKVTDTNSQYKNSKTPYIIYTGNLYPHKNANILIEALTKLPYLQLKIICARNYFTKRLQKFIKKNKVSRRVQFLGYIPDNEFKKIYSQALALVHPSFMEGFSLTGLEAMALNCPVISSNHSCLPEIYQDSVLYFDPNNVTELVEQIDRLYKSPDLRQKLITLGHRQLKKYSWNKTAKETFSVYKKILNDR
jgi:glycosyltransferase involved in cell wall biosynthesis